MAFRILLVLNLQSAIKPLKVIVNHSSNRSSSTRIKIKIILTLYFVDSIQYCNQGELVLASNNMYVRHFASFYFLIEIERKKTIPAAIYNGLLLLKMNHQLCVTCHPQLMV